jgi:hypothetical protein
MLTGGSMVSEGIWSCRLIYMLYKKKLLGPQFLLTRVTHCLHFLENSVWTRALLNLRDVIGPLLNPIVHFNIWIFKYIPQNISRGPDTGTIDFRATIFLFIQFIRSSLWEIGSSSNKYFFFKEPVPYPSSFCPAKSMKGILYFRATMEWMGSFHPTKGILQA